MQLAISREAFRSCVRKHSYMTRKIAQDAAANARKRGQPDVHVYPCRHCGAFHIGHKPR